jgi:hypothetical protein
MQESGCGTGNLRPKQQVETTLAWSVNWRLQSGGTAGLSTLGVDDYQAELTKKMADSD